MAAYKKVVIYVLLVFLVLIFLTPVYILFVTSIKDLKEIGVSPPWSLPKNSKFIENYSYVWSQKTVGMKYFFLNSFKISIPTVIITILFSLMAAYPLARYNLKLNNFLLGATVLAITLPHQVMIIHIFKMINFFHLYDTIFGLIFVNVGYGLPFAIFLFRNYMIQIPKEMQEAAKIDGANNFQIFTKIITPLCKPAIAVMAILEFTWVFNEFFHSLVLTSDSARPATVATAILKSGSMYASHWEYQSAAAVILSLPTLIVFLIFQKYFVKGIMLGSVKG